MVVSYRATPRKCLNLQTGIIQAQFAAVPAVTHQANRIAITSQNCPQNGGKELSLFPGYIHQFFFYCWPSCIIVKWNMNSGARGHTLLQSLRLLQQRPSKYGHHFIMWCGWLPYNNGDEVKYDSFFRSLFYSVLSVITIDRTCTPNKCYTIESINVAHEWSIIIIVRSCAACTIAGVLFEADSIGIVCVCVINFGVSANVLSTQVHMTIVGSEVNGWSNYSFLHNTNFCE